MALLLEICRKCTWHQERTKSLETFNSELANLTVSTDSPYLLGSHHWLDLGWGSFSLLWE